MIHSCYHPGKSAGPKLIRIFSFTIAASIFCHSPALAAGDLDHDSNVDLRDAILSFEIMRGRHPSMPVFNDADVDGDGRLGLAEAIYCLRCAAGLMPGPEVDNDGDGYTENQGDCNDADDRIYPGAFEICGDGIDQDCDGGDLLCDQCRDIAGNWNGTETVILTCCQAGDCETDTFNGTNTVFIQQNGCNLSYDLEISGYGDYGRTGTAAGNQIQLAGQFVLLQPWCIATENSITITGTINDDLIIFQGEGAASGTCNGTSFSCTGTSSGEFSR